MVWAREQTATGIENETLAAPPTRPGQPDRDASARRVARLVAALDERISEQVDAILHHPKFQRLEARWRALRTMVEDVAHSPQGHLARIVVLTVTWNEVRRDLRDDWERSRIFDKVYSQGFGVAGGLPIGLLIGDFEFRMGPSDLSLLRSLAQIAAAAFAPFVAAAHPSLVGLDRDFGELGRVLDVQALARQVAIPAWASLRSHPDSRFVSLTLPRTLARPPHRTGYSATTLRVCARCSTLLSRYPVGVGCPQCEEPGTTATTRVGFCYRESARSRRDLAWASGAFAVGRVALRCFLETGWHVDLFGMSYPIGPAGLRTPPSRGLLRDLPSVDPELHPSPSSRFAGVEVSLGSWYERELVDLGFVPIARVHGTPDVTVTSVPSVQRPEPADSVNARLASMLHYVLCLSRIAHCLKVMARDFVGGTTDDRGLERTLNAWINRYVSPNDHADEAIRARFPLREAQVSVRPRVSQPGTFDCILRVRPHSQIDDVMATMRLESAGTAMRAEEGARDG